MPLTKRLRMEILRRDSHTCRYCGATAPDVKLTIDHVIPVALGGDDLPSNLVAACADCNAGKSSTQPDQPLVAQVTQDDIRWAAAIKRAALIAEAEAAPRRQYIEHIDEMWGKWRYGINKDQHIPRPTSWRASVGALHDRGLPIEMASEAVRIAGNAAHVSADEMFRYFMGVAWKKLTAIEVIAKELYASDIDLSDG